MYNKVILIGRLGKDPELNYTQSGKAVCSFSIATSEVWFDKESQEKMEKTEWHRIVVWGKQAENCGKYLAKGKQVQIDGKLATRSWETEDGTKRYTTEVVARSVLFLSRSGGERPPTPSESDGGAKSPHDAPAGDEDIPF